MSGHRITDLPGGPYRDILQDAEKRGTKLLPEAFDANTVILVGLADIIAELRQKVDQGPDPRLLNKWTDDR